MHSEKIAFLFPYNGSGGEKSIPSPLLAYDCDEFPTEFEMHAGVFFVGLHHKKPYYLEVQIVRDENGELYPVSAKRGLWLRLSDPKGHLNDIAASVDLAMMKCKFDEPGSYCIHANLLLDQAVIHENKAYFRVSKAI